MGREVRKVPPDWHHPQADHPGRGGRFEPLHYGAGGRYERQAREWLAEAIKWSNGERPKYAGDDAPEFYWDWDGGPREAEEYMLVGVPDEACTHFQLYETTTAGTPKGPVFATLDEVAEWAAEHATTFASMKADKATWLKILGGEPVMVEIAPGLYNVP
jgi:hypothetical protein